MRKWDSDTKANAPGELEHYNMPYMFRKTTSTKYEFQSTSRNFGNSDGERARYLLTIVLLVALLPIAASAVVLAWIKFLKLKPRESV